jgi:predicted DNA-binding transcriptional regulator YafY
MSSNDWSAILAKIPVRSVRTVLRDLAELRMQFNQGRKVSLPLVQVHLTSGTTLEGYVVALDSHRNQETLVMHSPRNEYRFPHQDLVYVEARYILGVTVADAHIVASHLSGGEVAEVSAEQQSISKLDVKRFIAQYVEDFKQLENIELTCDVEWETLPAGGNTYLNLKDEIAALFDAMSEIMRFENGRTALQALKKVTIRAGNALEAIREDETLIIASVYLDAPRRVSDRVAIQAAIEKAL